MKKGNIRINRYTFDGDYIGQSVLHRSLFIDYMQSQADFGYGAIIELTGSEEGRTTAYANGIDIEGVHYVKLGRSASKAKDAKCLFIRDNLADRALAFLSMKYDIEDPSGQAYAALVMSALVDTEPTTIKAENILVVKDVSVKIHKDKIFDVFVENGELRGIETAGDLDSTLWDGMSLIQSGCGVTEWASLRNHWFKSCAFEFDLASYFSDHGVETVTDIFGRELLTKDIKLVTTENSIKWYKKDKSLNGWNKWVEHIERYGTPFAINKEGHRPSWVTNEGKHLLPMSYQMVNTLRNKNYKSIIRTTDNFIKELWESDEAFSRYIDSMIGYCSYGFLSSISKYPAFINTTEFQAKKQDVIHDDIKVKANRGRILQEAGNLTACSNPIALMNYVCTGEVKSEFSEGNAYTNCAELGEEFACFRSPHNAQNNVYYCHQEHIEDIDHYMNIGQTVLVVDSVNNDIQARCSGEDFDSDFNYCTSQHYITKWAKEYQDEFPTIRNSVKQVSGEAIDIAAFDHKVGHNSDIGSSANLAMWLVSMYHHTNDKKWIEAACMASTITQLAVDATKKTFEIDPHKSLNKLQKKTGYDEGVRPNYWKYVVARGKDSKVVKWIDCPQEHYYNPTYKGKSKKNADFLFYRKPTTKRLPSLKSYITAKNYNNQEVNELYFVLYKAGKDLDRLRSEVGNSEDSWEEYTLAKDEVIDKLIKVFNEIKAPKSEKAEQLVAIWLEEKTIDWVLIDIIYEIAPKTVASCCWQGVISEAAENKVMPKRQKKHDPYRKNKED